MTCCHGEIQEPRWIQLADVLSIPDVYRLNDLPEIAFSFILLNFVKWTTNSYHNTLSLLRKAILSISHRNRAHFYVLQVFVSHYSRYFKPGYKLHIWEMQFKWVENPHSVALVYDWELDKLD